MVLAAYVTSFLSKDSWDDYSVRCFDGMGDAAVGRHRFACQDDRSSGAAILGANWIPQRWSRPDGSGRLEASLSSFPRREPLKRSLAASSKQQAASSKQQAASNKQQATSNKQQAASNKQQATSSKQQAASASASLPSWDVSVHRERLAQATIWRGLSCRVHAGAHGEG
ncbi:hypothetical protein LL965_02885 [Xanthomonas cassavae CFBP 4642]|uniref:Uncharacterized protein n=1 Tax=Xanthomonas cassavae CFBP 4642 TaxID=1219375 RepID=A0ABS8HA78_9XANT|nr:hypothetical protein [Xanthomonas cassavae CFBP 4642]